MAKTRTEYAVMDEVLQVRNLFDTGNISYIHVFVVTVEWFGDEGLARRKECLQNRTDFSGKTR